MTVLCRIALVALLVLMPGLAAGQDFVSDTRAHLQRLEKLGFAGVVVVVRDGVPLLAEGYGLADRERGIGWTPGTVSTVGSITKQFTGAAILALVEAGLLRVEDTLPQHFANVPRDKAHITLHQLLTHSSGISDPPIDDWDPVKRDAYVRRVLDQPLSYPPGTGYEYSNAGYSLLGAIIEQLTGGSWEEYVRGRLFLPNGLYETGYILPRWGGSRLAQGYRDGTRWGTVLERPMDVDGPYWALRANGGVHATAWDMVRWAQALLDGQVLSAASMEKLWSPLVREPGDSWYGYGWVVLDLNGTRVITHNGGNGIHFADLAIIPSSRTVVFLQSNVIAEVPVAQQLLERIGGRLLAGTAYPEVPDRVDVASGELEQYAGTYRVSGGGELVVTAEPDRVVVETASRDAFRRLYSSRPVDSARASRLEALMEAIVTAGARGDFEPMHQARGDDVPADRLALRQGEWVAEQEGRLGGLQGQLVVGSAFQEGRDVVLVRYRFARGTADRVYVWDPEVESRLRGISGRGLEIRLGFVPTGPGRFASWDGGFTASRPMAFGSGPDGMRLEVGEGPNRLTAHRR